MSRISRREFLRLAGGAGAAAAGASACGEGKRFRTPDVDPPPFPKPGQWIHFASTCRECPAGCGLDAIFRDGRVTKVEGNPGHPVSRGGLCARGQSSVQGLYDPDRVRAPRRRAASGWDETLGIQAIEGVAAGLRGASRAIVVSGLQTGSPAAVLAAFASAWGSERPLFYERFNYESVRRAHGLVFGAPVVPRIDFARADYVLSFGADFLETWISPVEYAAGFAAARAFADGRMARFVYAGPRFSMTAGNADVFYRLSSDDLRLLAFSVAERLGPSHPGVRSFLDARREAAAALSPRVDAIIRDLAMAERPLAVAGGWMDGALDRDLAVAAALINASTGSNAVDFSRPHALTGTDTAGETAKLLDSIGPEDAVFVVDTNPAFTLPGAAESLRKARLLVYAGVMADETASLADWILPVRYPLEDWGDYEPYAGLTDVLQPAMQPLNEIPGAADLLVEISAAAGRPLTGPDGAPIRDFREFALRRWRAAAPATPAAAGRPANVDEEQLAPAGTAATATAPTAFPDDLLRRGFFLSAERPAPSAGAPSPKTKPPAPTPSPEGGTEAAPLPPVRIGDYEPASGAAPGAPEGRGLRLEVYPSIYLFDGRQANRGWLQEAPDPMSTIVWSNWADIHPSSAASLGVSRDEVVTVRSDAGEIRVPVRVTDDVAPGTVAILSGQGHAALGRNARGRGGNPFVLLAPGPDRPPQQVEVARTGRTHFLVNLSASQRQFGREIVQWVAASRLAAMTPGEGDAMIMPLPEGYDPKRDVYPPHPHRNHRWAMGIDLHACVGCGACAVACYAENNIQVVGEDSCSEGREMAWLKVTPYRADGRPSRVGWLVLPCQHCDSAPCEAVCPVFAAVNNEEGLNAQIYNRCIGTRYCSNNCPYKVRRFNWFTPAFPAPLDVQLNPEVTVRTRGVMEKCTFCVQRIREAEFKAAREGRDLRDGEVRPACVESCPTKAFVFGDLLDPKSRVNAVMRSDLRRYQLLKDLNTKPAVVYLRRIDAEPKP